MKNLALLLIILIAFVACNDGVNSPDPELVIDSDTALSSTENPILTSSGGLSSSTLSSTTLSSPILSSSGLLSSSSILPTSSAGPFGPLGKMAFYITAHEDDWQIFMGDHAHKDILEADEVIFIYITAGEAGKDETFWNAREQGALNSIAWTLNDSSPIESFGLNFNNNQVVQTIIAHTKSYFLRLPDGNGSGDGFSAYNNQSLSKLKSGNISTIQNVNKTASYTWDQLVTTVQDIIHMHAKDNWDISFHLQDHDTGLNPGNHPDHITASLLAQEAIATTGLDDITFFLDYSNSRYGVNISAEVIALKTGLFNAYDAKMQELAYYNTIEREGDIYHTWLARTYFRTATEPYNIVW